MLFSRILIKAAIAASACFWAVGGHCATDIGFSDVVFDEAPIANTDYALASFWLQNFGSTTIDDFTLTATLPAGSIFGGGSYTDGESTATGRDLVFRSGGLEPGEMFFASLTFKPMVATGTITFPAVVGLSAPDDNPANDTAAATFDILPPTPGLPDLFVSWPTKPKQAPKSKALRTGGYLLKGKVLVQNDSDVVVEEGTQLALYVSADDTISMDDQHIETVELPKIKPGKRRTVKFKPFTDQDLAGQTLFAFTREPDADPTDNRALSPPVLGK